MSKIDELLKNEKATWRKLGEVCEIISGSSFPKQFQGKYLGKYAFYKVSDMNKCTIVMDKAENYIDDEDLKKLKAKLIPKDALIFPKVGATLSTNKKRLLVKESCVDNNILALVAKKIHYKYLYYIFSKENLLYFANGNGAVPSIDMEKLKNYKIPIPSIQTQEKIVKILDNFTNYVTELQTELQLRLKQYQYYRDMLLSEEYLNKLSNNPQILGLGGYKLRLVTLGEIAKIKNGKDWKTLGKGNIPVYGSGGNMNIFVDKCSYNKPTVLIPRKGSIGNVFYLDEPFWNVDTIFYTEIDDEKIIPKYLYYFIENYDISNLSTDSTRPSLTQSILNKIKITLPHLPVQEHIVSILDKFDTLINDLSKGLPKEINLRQKQYEYYREKLLSFENN